LILPATGGHGHEAALRSHFNTSQSLISQGEHVPSRRTRKTMAVATKAAELAIVVPQVVAHRVARMAIAGPSPSERDRREFQRMACEKVNAFQESWYAMAMQAFRANQLLAASFVRAFWLPSLRGKPSANAVAAHLQGAALGVLDKAMAPVHRKAVANAKRLARTKLR
jgi:hypothetical protein